jgi:hypothetical protein
MFVAKEQAAWPAEGDARDLRFSLNAPVLLGAGSTALPTRAALGWLACGSGTVVRLWLRAEGAPEPVRAFDLPEAPLGPAARTAALERAERFLAGLGFLFAEGASTPALEPDRAPLGPAAPGPVATTLRTADPDPAPETVAPAPAVGAATAVRADVRLTQLRRRGPPAAAAGPLGPSGGIES